MVAVSIVGVANNDNEPVVILNSSATRQCLSEQVHAMIIKPTHAVADTGATSVFVMEGTPCKNLRLAENPITFSLPDGKKVTLMHICNITIPGLPFTLLGHIVPKMKVASLLGIRVLFKVQGRLQSIFDDKKCQVIFNNKVILTGIKVPSSN
jgi:hypothetical protein